MNATILHESCGRMRLRLRQTRMTLEQADRLEAWLQARAWARQVTVHERTCCVIIHYDGDRQAVLEEVRRFSWQEAETGVALPAHSSRATNREFEEKLVGKVSAVAFADCPDCLAHASLCAPGASLLAAEADQSGAAGCTVSHHFRLPR